MRALCRYGLLVALTGMGFAIRGAAQSLAEAAKREAARRRDLEKAGVAAREIDMTRMREYQGRGNLSLSTVPPGGVAAGKSPREPARGSPQVYRKALEKLDREIRAATDRLALLVERQREERWAPPRGRSKGSSRATDDLRWQIKELEARLSRLKSERLKVYNEGRRAGFLPGELDGRGRIH